MKILIIFGLLLAWSCTPVKAQDTLPCPNNLPCKILVLTDDQISTLDQIITNTALQGPYVQINQVVQFYKELLAKAPAGKVTPPETKK